MAMYTGGYFFPGHSVLLRSGFMKRVFVITPQMRYSWDRNHN